MDSQTACSAVKQITAELEKVFIGQPGVIEQSLVALLAEDMRWWKGFPVRARPF
jgi:hypothetical protein